MALSSKKLPIVDWLQIESSAPGKFIISGEYSVVYDKPAVAATIDLRTCVKINPNRNGKVRLSLKNLNDTREWATSSFTTCRLISKYSECLDYNDMMASKLNHLLHSRYRVDTVPLTKPVASAEDATNQPSTSDQSDVGSAASETKPVKNTTKDEQVQKQADDAVMAFLLLYIGLGDSFCSSARVPIEVEVESAVPVGAGLGSSSAYSVALCGALMRVFRVAAEKYIISNWALNIDKYFHGKPSGIDNSIISCGGYILFQMSKVKYQGNNHNNSIRVVLIDTGVSRSTRALGEMVATKLRTDPDTINGIFTTISEITSQIWRRVSDANFNPESISELLQENQKKLDELGVGHEKLSDICLRARKRGLVAKQTGAGGGGTAFVLYNAANDCTNVEDLKSELTCAGYKIHDHAVGCDGLTVKILPDPEKQFSLGGDRN